MENIGKLLSLDNTSLSHLSGQELEQTRTSLEIERIWLQFRLGVITQPEKDQFLTNKFGQLKQDNPDLYRLFVAGSEYGLSMAQEIRDKVFPPLRVAGYHTKR